MLSAPPLERIASSIAPDELGLRVAALTLHGWHEVSVRILRPFSWDAKHRGFEVVDLEIGVGTERSLVIGPYAAADAAAWNVDPTHDVGFPNSPDQDGVLYRTQGVEAGVNDRFQDAAGWFTLTARDSQGHAVALAAAVDRSDTVVIRLVADHGGLRVSMVLPRVLAEPSAAARRDVLPGLLATTTRGGHPEAEELLRQAIASVIPTQSRHEAPPLIADTWGFGTAISPGLVDEFARSAARLGAEIVTLDKGWEAAVGDWVAADGYVGGVSGLADAAAAHGMRLGLWMAVGNVDPHSRTLRDQPQWRAIWRGEPQIVSHTTYSLCLGHGPVQEHLIDTLDRLAGEGLRWFLHDFETISRCDAEHHDHDPGLGEAAAVDGWYRVLSAVRLRHPNLRIENCWNGGRPLDLAMIAHHDTTIGDDWCDVHHNVAAKLGLGRYLPASWCSAYMSDELQLPDRAQFAVYAVGGPWVIMGDPRRWSSERREVAEAAIATYREWQATFSHSRVEAARLTVVDGARTRRPAGTAVLGVELHDDERGTLVAVVIPEPDTATELRWHSRFATGSHWVHDHYTGEERELGEEEISHGMPLKSDRSEGYLFSVMRRA